MAAWCAVFLSHLSGDEVGIKKAHTLMQGLIILIRLFVSHSNLELSSCPFSSNSHIPVCFDSALS